MLDIYGFSDVLFWLYGIIFFVACFFSLYIPGNVVLHTFFREKRTDISQIALSFVLGIVLWMVQGYIFGYLGLRWLTIPYLVIFFLFFVLQKKTIHLRNVKKHIKDNVLLTLLIVLGSFTQWYGLMTSGMRYSDGIRYYLLNAYDGIMHLGFIASMVKTFPPVEPGAFDLPLTNYHYWSDLFFAEFNRVWGIPISHMYFQYFPFAFAVLTGILVLMLLSVWKSSRLVKVVSLLFVYFSGNASYIVMLILHKTMGMDQTPAIDNGPTVFFNMPQAFARVVFLAALLFLHKYIKEKRYTYGILSMVLFSVLFGLKIYFGVFSAVGLLAYFVVRFVRYILQHVRQRDIKKCIFNVCKDISLGLVFTFSTLLIYLPANKSAGGLYMVPLVWPKLMLGLEKINWNDWWLRMQVYEEAGNTRNIIILYAMCILVFFISAYGVRLFGFFILFSKKIELFFEERVFFLTAIIVSTFIGMNMLQVSGGFNVFNFFVVSLFPLSIFSGYVFEFLWKSKYRALKVFALIFLLMALPRPIHELWNMTKEYTIGKNFVTLTPEEQDVYTYFRTNTDKNMLLQTSLMEKKDRETLYLSFFADRPTYYTSEGMLESHNQPVQERKRNIQTIFTSTESAKVNNAIYASGIDYLYLHNAQEMSHVMATSSALLRVYTSGTYSVYQVIGK